MMESGVGLDLPFGLQIEMPSFLQPDPVKMRQDPKWLSKVKAVKQYSERLYRIIDLAPTMEAMTDDQLRAKTDEFRSRLSSGSTLDDILVEAFAVVREASRRTLGLYHYDVQLIGGMVLHEGKIAEMATGEGKTLVATLPMYLNALNGKGAHLITVNDYLARRDGESLGVMYRFLGLSVGIVQGEMNFYERRAAYACDITYVTNNEVGFDYLRDNMAYGVDELVQRAEGFAFCIVDEADSILIDEARTPLIISESGGEASLKKYQTSTEVVKYLQKGVHFDTDDKARRCTLTDGGYEQVCVLLGVKDLYNASDPWVNFINNSLNALFMYQRDVAYIVRGDEIVIVDEFTGRIMEGRRWNGGLHQAMEAKEGLGIKPENITAASISFQALFQLYPKLAGMTGTAQTQAEELLNVYKLQVDSVPTARPMVRDDMPDLVYPTKYGKFLAIQERVKELHSKGQPVLVGTTSIEDSVLISELFKEIQIPHRVLNAKPEVAERESEIVGQAGRSGAVTIATNMAGRGTDILLGGNASLTARLRLRQTLVSTVKPELAKRVRVDPSLYPCELSQEAEASLQAAVSSFEQLLLSEEAKELEDNEDQNSKGPSTTILMAEEIIAAAVEVGETDPARLQELQVAIAEAYRLIKKEYDLLILEDRDKVRGVGGLAVIGSERHESRRIDKQLRGRSGRQGDKGSSIFVISLEDQIFKVFGKEAVDLLQSQFEMLMSDNEPLSSPLLAGALTDVQKKVEGFYQDSRNNLVEYDSVTDKQRQKFYSQRRQVVMADSTRLKAIHRQYLDGLVRDVCFGGGPWKPATDAEGLSRCVDVLNEMTDAVDIDKEEAMGKLSSAAVPTALETLVSFLTDQMYKGLESQWSKLENMEETPQLCEDVMRFMILREMDRGWKAHLQELDSLRDTVGLVSFGGKKPLEEWTFRSFDAFKILEANIYRFASMAMLGLRVDDMRRADSSAASGSFISTVPSSNDVRQEMAFAGNPIINMNLDQEEESLPGGNKSKKKKSKSKKKAKSAQPKKGFG